MDVSRSGTGGPWSNVWRKSGADYRGPATETVDLTAFAAGYSNVVIRFRYYNARDEMFWQVDDVRLQCDVCDPNYDSDGDGFADVNDNCPFAHNPTQADLDADGYGDACDDDKDGDGMPNDWEIQRGLNSTNAADASLDPDEDGFSNYQEYRADTDPYAADSVLLLRASGQARMLARLEFMTSTNRRYQVLYKDPPLNSTNRWLYSGYPFWGQTNLVTRDDPSFSSNSVSARYYRLLVLPP